MRDPSLSVVVVTYEMSREISRTLSTFSASYQRGIGRHEYEVVLVDNGSRTPPRAEDHRGLDVDLRCFTHPSPSPSPAGAVNHALRECRGRFIGVLIDGARMVSPGLLAAARDALQSAPRTVVGFRGRYLGPGFQSETMFHGYDRDAEDRLLYSIGWQADGYRLFAASVFDESTGPTWYGPITESNGLFMRRELWDELGGVDARFQSAGGGLVNLDTWSRATGLSGATVIVPIGEATFHQIHGGTMTNAADQPARWRRLCAEYRAIRGRSYRRPGAAIRFEGHFRHDPPESELVPPAVDWRNGWGWPRRLVRRVHRWPLVRALAASRAGGIPGAAAAGSRRGLP